ncbi:MAG: hypothetical protein Q9157_009209, partial [Trypethelium eluteriae]
ILRLRADGVAWSGVARVLNHARPAHDPRRGFDAPAVYSAWLIQSAAITRVFGSEGAPGEARAAVEEHLRNPTSAGPAAAATATDTAVAAAETTSAKTAWPLPPPTIEDVRRRRREREETEARAIKEAAERTAAGVDGAASGVAPVAPVHWSREDDETLLGLSREYEARIWGEIAERMAGMRGRRFSGDQCKQRFTALKRK